MSLSSDLMALNPCLFLFFFPPFPSLIGDYTLPWSPFIYSAPKPVSAPLGEG